MILALDPGSEETAYVLTDSKNIVEFAKVDNRAVGAVIDSVSFRKDISIVCEMVACYGMPVGAEIFDTCVWIGRHWGNAAKHALPWHTITRTEVKRRMCGRTAGVNDGVIRQRLIDMYGPGRTKAIGTKKNPGPLYGVSGDVWAALAVAKAWEMAS